MVNGHSDLEETLHFQISLLKLAANTNTGSIEKPGEPGTRELERLAERVPVRLRPRRAV